MIDFFGAGYDASLLMEILPDLERIHSPVSRLPFVDERGETRFSLPYTRLRHRIFQDRHFNFMRGDLERVLFERVAGRVEIRFSTTIETIERIATGTRVHLTDGSAHEVDLVVGADGVHSHVRGLAFGSEARFACFVGYYTAAFILDTRPAEFGAADPFVTMWGGSSPS